MRYFEDLEVSAETYFGSYDVTREEVLEFARKYDPQPFHLSDEAAAKTHFGRLAASGWHTCAMFMRMMCDAFLLDSTSQGSPGIDHVRWKKPVLAGDTLTGRSTVLAKRLSKSRSDLGFVTMRAELFNQHGETVFELENTGMFLTRSGAGR